MSVKIEFIKIEDTIAGTIQHLTCPYCGEKSILHGNIAKGMIRDTVGCCHCKRKICELHFTI